jgi:hypothetical protein
MSPEKSRCFKIFSDISKTTASIRGGEEENLFCHIKCHLKKGNLSRYSLIKQKQ